MANHRLPCNHGVDHQRIHTATMTPTDCLLLLRQVRMCHGVFIQYLRHHCGQKLVRGIQAGNGSVLLWSSLVSRFGYQNSPPLHKSCRDVFRITPQLPHTACPRSSVAWWNCLHQKPYMPSHPGAFQLLIFLTNLAPDASVNKFHNAWRRFVRHPESPVSSLRPQRSARSNQMFLSTTFVTQGSPCRWVSPYYSGLPPRSPRLI